MPFNFKKDENFSYKTPQEMYQDNKLKKIMGPLDYQTEMLNSYMNKFTSANIALELPTGSGKTLIGLLIGEFRRRKNKERILFLCPTKQLVNQVVEQANENYGIKAIAFCGRQKEYSQQDKTNYYLKKAIGVTTYSSFFAKNSYFTDPDIIIMDDIHSAENYIISNWSIEIDHRQNIYSQLLTFLRDFLTIDAFENLQMDNELNPNKNWCDLIPMPLLKDKISELRTILNSSLERGTSNYFSYNSISSNIEGCNVFLSKEKILIRPLIPPTMTHTPFKNATQKILMSATLGRGGELERITGIKNIQRLPIVNEWDKRSIGRKFFIFPDLSFNDRNDRKEIITDLHKITNKSVFLVPNNNMLNKATDFFAEDLPETTIFNISELETSKCKFTKSDNAVVILSNRFDGIDFPDDESRMLFIKNIPKVTNLQEQFLVNRMGSLKLYEEQIRTRIIQAVGRCSRNARDYSVVCIINDTNFITDNILENFSPELHAEIQLGIEMSSNYSNIEEIITNVNEFLAKDDEWQKAEDYIVDLKTKYSSKPNKIENELLNKLSDSAKNELTYQYEMWKGNYENAFNAACNVVNILNAPSLMGYKNFWCFLAGSAAYYLYLQHQTDYKKKSKEYFDKAQNNNFGMKWLSHLSQKLFMTRTNNINDFFEDILENIENLLNRTANINKLQERISTILNNLKSTDGRAFERGHNDLGLLLGYNAKNSDDHGAPDPYWIINSTLVIVAEDKIYKEPSDGEVKDIPLEDITEACRHETWIRHNEKSISKDAEVITIFITNSKSINDKDRIQCKNLYYINKDDFIDWAIVATKTIRNIYNNFSDIGDYEWRSATHKKFVDNKITPSDYVKFITKTKLSKI